MKLPMMDLSSKASSKGKRLKLNKMTEAQLKEKVNYLEEYNQQYKTLNKAKDVLSNRF